MHAYSAISACIFYHGRIRRVKLEDYEVRLRVKIRIRVSITNYISPDFIDFRWVDICTYSVIAAVYNYIISYLHSIYYGCAKSNTY